MAWESEKIQLNWIFEKKVKESLFCLLKICCWVVPVACAYCSILFLFFPDQGSGSPFSVPLSDSIKFWNLKLNAHIFNMGCPVPLESSAWLATFKLRLCTLCLRSGETGQEHTAGNYNCKTRELVHSYPKKRKSGAYFRHGILKEREAKNGSGWCHQNKQL